MSKKQEIELLQTARQYLDERVFDFVCICIEVASIQKTISAKTKTIASKWVEASDLLRREVMEFLDGERTVQKWLDGTSKTTVRHFQFAIIDTMLARRGVK